MQDSFDPYQQWLDIPPDEQPPNYYRLLGLEPFEGDPVTIEFAAADRISGLRAFAEGEREALVKRLVQEVCRARNALKDPERKKRYDAQLRKLSAQPPALPVAKAVAVAEDDSDAPTPPAELPEIVTGAGASVRAAARSSPARGKAKEPTAPTPVAGLPEIVIDTGPAAKAAARSSPARGEKAKEPAAPTPVAGLPEIVADAKPAAKAAARSSPARGEKAKESTPAPAVADVPEIVTDAKPAAKAVARSSPARGEKAKESTAPSPVAGLPEIVTDAKPAAKAVARSSPARGEKAKEPAAPTPIAGLPEIVADTQPTSGTASRPASASMTGTSARSSAGHARKTAGRKRSQTEVAAWCIGGSVVVALGLALMLLLSGGSESQGEGRSQQRSGTRRRAPRQTAPQRPSTTRLRPSPSQRPRGPATLADLLEQGEAEAAAAAGGQPSLPPELPELSDPPEPPPSAPAEQEAPPSGPAASPSAAAPVPDADSVAEAVDRVRDLLQDEFAAAGGAEKRAELGRRLLALGEETADDPARRYACFSLARDQAVRVGDPQLIEDVVRRTGRHYQIDALALQAEMMAAAWRSDYAVPHRPALLQRSRELLDEALRAENHAAAAHAVRVVLAGARAASDHRLIGELQDLQRQIRAAAPGEDP